MGRNIPDPFVVPFATFSVSFVSKSCLFLFCFQGMLFSCPVSAFVGNSLYSAKEVVLVIWRCSGR